MLKRTYPFAIKIFGLWLGMTLWKNSHKEIPWINRFWYRGRMAGIEFGRGKVEFSWQWVGREEGRLRCGVLY
jgi:hypothetical protein